MSWWVVVILWAKGNKDHVGGVWTFIGYKYIEKDGAGVRPLTIS